jgi:hypothetical protein
MAELSHDEVVEVLGRRLSDVIIAEIIATGITKDELAAARERVLSDRKPTIRGLRWSQVLSPKWSISWSARRAAGSWARLAPRWNSSGPQFSSSRYQIRLEAWPTDQEPTALAL